MVRTLPLRLYLAPVIFDSSHGTAAALISPSVCRTFILGAECNDPLCTKRHYANDDLLEAMQQSRVNA